MHSDQAAIIQGRYSDGQTAQSAPVDVQLTGRGVEISFPGAPQALVWPYGALGVATPVTSKTADVLLTYSHMPGATLFFADAEAVRLLARSAPQITSRAYGWRSARPWIIATGCVALLFAGLWLIEASPARWIAALMPDRVRAGVGDQVVASMVGNRKECTAPEGRAALDSLVERLSNASSTSPGSRARFKVRVVDWGLLNAFAVPGEQIVLTRAIITQAKTPEEVAGVLAHEMGHGLELHPETSIVRVIGLTAALELMTGGGGAIANIGLGLTQLGYTRAAEREADARGLALLERSQIAASGLIDFFKRIGEIEKKRGGGTDWNLFRTHPQSEERAKSAAARPTYPTRPALDAAQWQALRLICGPPRLESDPDQKPGEKK